MRRCVEIVEAALDELDASLDDVVRTRVYLTEGSTGNPSRGAHGAAFGNARPAAPMVVVKALLDPRWTVEIEAEALLRS